MSGRADYDGGHILSAGFADLTGDLCDTNSPIEFAVPTPEQFCLAMGKLGVGDDSHVVLYDGYLSGWATRVWWMLRWVGFDRASHSARLHRCCCLHRLTPGVGCRSLQPDGG